MKLKFEVSNFVIVKHSVTGFFYAIRKVDFPLGKWEDDSEEEIMCIPISKDGLLEEMFERNIPKNEIDTNIWVEYR